MKMLGKGVLDEFKKKHTDAISQVDSWEQEVEVAEWKTPLDIKQRYVSASILEDNNVIFNIKGNKYRILTKVNYKNRIVLVKRAGTHEEYNKW
jgi:mRNA interferase HigB